jgi:hypothetical protein
LTVPILVPRGKPAVTAAINFHPRPRSFPDAGKAFKPKQKIGDEERLIL